MKATAVRYNLAGRRKSIPRRDFIHDAVRNALIKDGWTITADPYRIPYGDENLYIDLAAELPLAAQRDDRRIAVEIKSFLGRSPINDVQEALGQYALYLSVLEDVDPERKLYLAFSKAVYDEFIQIRAFVRAQQRFHVALIVMQISTEEIVQWIP